MIVLRLLAFLLLIVIIYFFFLKHNKPAKASLNRIYKFPKALLFASVTLPIFYVALAEYFTRR